MKHLSRLFSLVAALISSMAILQAQTTAKSIQLSLNENPFGPTKSVLEKIQEESQQIARYTAEEGQAFIASLAQYEGVDTDQIIPGELLAQLGIYLGIKGGAGGEFIYTVPGYPVLAEAAGSVGGKIIEVPLNEHLENDLDAIEAHITPQTQAVFLVNPHNPSGTVNDKDRFLQFLHRVSSRTLVIVDEAYLEYTDDFAGRTAVNNLKAGDQVIVFRTFAKMYGLAGLGMGYAVAPKTLAKFLREQGLGNPHELNRISIAAASAALKDQAFVSHVKHTVDVERQKWFELLEQLGLRYTSSQANFVFFDAKKPYQDTYRKFEEAGIHVSRSFAPYNTWIRITIGLPEENEKARNVLKAFLQ
ncbi:aminotransferase class I/II-fold pyridoxal phosphate-dependent enzyme [Olivibacter sp. SDN3]|uniref:pyridoxal phosphate-dependent aminotransferase n=1 Tax=Olivibacter sp. SDN3 TaxID=2764720 RepID=UPI001650FA8C|nr:histidinol-phosphate transaminase [Olivibacter sp. SDN3]QNL48264.1 aminotransferase class I/II-fold pyridoxal phosphate-dependent enzyme [Olivibacter sp. SDN3]